jgi:aspartyl/asparaginyl-tRNA synthetase
MKESTLLKIALICSLVGLTALYFTSTRIEVKDYRPSLLNKNIGDDVKLNGFVSKITDKGNVIFIDVNQQYPITVVLFTDDDNLKLKSGDNIEVIGEVQEYKGKTEIIAEKIRVIR